MGADRHGMMATQAIGIELSAAIVAVIDDAHRC